MRETNLKFVSVKQYEHSIWKADGKQILHSTHSSDVCHCVAWTWPCEHLGQWVKEAWTPSIGSNLFVWLLIYELTVSDLTTLKEVRLSDSLTGTFMNDSIITSVILHTNSLCIWRWVVLPSILFWATWIRVIVEPLSPLMMRCVPHESAVGHLRLLRLQYRHCPLIGLSVREHRLVVFNYAAIGRYLPFLRE